eukprot:TRINITY_DN12710_c0_g1_i6.p1 TRINITY_DN12710_c0_g1~~TRINITY_DN12710_c0_g1_i6.p1  ORF type:complete len:627 (-),score=149.14 TRINITY_DN12710_c0_g1_i6:76-1956(-)
MLKTLCVCVFFFQAEDGIRDAQESRGLGDVYKRQLQPHAWKPIPVGSVTPKGWLLTQLKLQADGLSGHLSQFWPDIKDSIWIGGGADGGLHERTPYWLNGIVPLAYLLQNSGDSIVAHAGFHGIYKNNQQHGCDAQHYCGDPVNITAQMSTYIEYMLSHVGQDGWIGPDSNSTTDGDQYWGPSNALNALCQYAEGQLKTRGDTTGFTRVAQIVAGHLIEQKRRMGTAKLASWSFARWIDMAYTAEWLLDHAEGGKLTEEQSAEMMDLIGMLHDQGADWDGWFESFEGDAGGHNVNNAQGLKSSAVWYRYSGNSTMHTLAARRMANLDRLYGLPTGMFNGDEILPSPATRNPSRGIELCGVVEAMWSYNVLFSVHGHVSLADRSERIAYNALPATWASPTGGDMWAHQYLQSVNQVKALKADPHVWTHDGDMAETYGLEPNFGCCTANFNQGWPKFAHMAVYEHPSDNGIAVVLYAPMKVEIGSTGVVVEVETGYPFNDTVVVSVTNPTLDPVPLYLRVPGWADKATINGEEVCNGSMHMAGSVGPKRVNQTFTLDLNPRIRLEEWDNGAVSVHRGVLMYSFPIGPNYTVTGHHFGDATMSNDYSLDSTDPWNFACLLYTSPSPRDS